MTIREWVVDYCFQRGMPPRSANAVLEKVMADEVLTTELRSRWDDSTSDYPEAMLGAISLYIDEAAVACIEANQPRAW